MFSRRWEVKRLNLFVNQVCQERYPFRIPSYTRPAGRCSPEMEYSAKFDTERAPPRPSFRKGTFFVYLLLTNGIPFTVGPSLEH